MIAVIGTYRIPVEHMDAVKGPMADVIAATRKEDGCVLYSFAEDVLEPGLIRVAERWESRDHLKAHVASDHMQVWAGYREKFAFYDRDIKVYDIGEGGPL